MSNNDIKQKSSDLLREVANLSNSQVIRGLKIFAFILAAILILFIVVGMSIGCLEKVVGLISGLAILISALLASYSVMFNIEKTESLKKQDICREKAITIQFARFSLDSIQKDFEYLAAYLEDYKKETAVGKEISKTKKQHIFKTTESLNSLHSKLLTKEVISVLELEEEKELMKDILDSLEGLKVTFDDIFSDPSNNGDKLLEVINNEIRPWCSRLVQLLDKKHSGMIKQEPATTKYIQ